jgi:hypothetical protein
VHYNSDTSYFDYLYEWFAFVYNFRKSDFMHCYGFLRQVANSAVPRFLSLTRNAKERDTNNVLQYVPDPVTGTIYTAPPGWEREAPDVTQAEVNSRAFNLTKYNTVMASLATAAYQDDEVSFVNEDYVIANIPGTQDPATICKSLKHSGFVRSYAVIGPATIKMSVNNVVSTTVYDEPGLHFFEFVGEAWIYTETIDPVTGAGLMFVSIFYNKRLENDTNVETKIPGAVNVGDLYMYFHQNPGGSGYNYSGNARFVQPNGTTQQLSVTDPAPSNLVQPGMRRVHWGGTSGFQFPRNVNPWLSGDKTKMLMTYDLATKPGEGLSIFYDPKAGTR